MSIVVALLVATTAVLQSLGGCSSNSPCVPGASVGCIGPNACSGYQVCGQDGQEYGACICGSPDAGADAAPDSASLDGASSEGAADASFDSLQDSPIDSVEEANDATTGDGPADVTPDAPTDSTVDGPSDSATDAMDSSVVDSSTDGSFTSDGSLCNECAQGQKFCNGCVSTSDVYFGCGNPSSCEPCAYDHADATCDGQNRCAMGSCKPGYADCDGLPGNGCETDLTAHDTCGACTKACQTGEVCTSNGCAASCPFPQTNCNGSCANLQSSPLHCGACQSQTSTCNDPVFGVASCSSGTCGVSCNNGYTDCTDVQAVHICADTSKDAYNCGTCTACPYNGTYSVRTCVSGKCSAQCLPGWTLCNGTCVVLSTDLANCGQCGNACKFGDVCLQGQCSNISAITLASGLNKPSDLLIDGTTLYFVDVAANDVDSIPSGGGSVTVLAPNEASPMRLAQDATYLYWSSNAGGAIREIPKLGGNASTVTTAVQPWGVAVDANYVYWSDGGSTIQRYPLGGGSAATIASLPKSELDLLGGTLYAASGLGYSIAVPNGPASLFLSSCSVGLAFDGTMLYCGDERGTISGPFHGGNLPFAGQATHAAANTCGGYITSSDLSSTTAPVYFYQQGLIGARPNWTMPWPVPVAFTNVAPGAQRIRSDGNYIYWTDSNKNAIYRFPTLQ